MTDHQSPPTEELDSLSLTTSDYKHNPKRGSNKSRGGHSQGTSSRGGRRGGEMDREVAISKALSKLLRHDAENVGLALDAEGFARVDQVLQYPRLKSLRASFPEIQSVVATNAKQRFSLKPLDPSVTTTTTTTSASTNDPGPDPSAYLIRANQGHSLSSVTSSNLLTPITLALNNIPPTVIHGTYFAFYPSILSSGGLSKMSRNHVHFSTGVPESDTGVLSGMRSDAELLIYVDVRRALEECPEMRWWRSENGVVLTEGVGEKGIVGTRYWERVVGRREDVGTLWRDGVEVAGLPEGVKGKLPVGKGARGRGRGGGRGGIAGS